MSVDAKAYLTGDVPFEEIHAFIKSAEDDNARLRDVTDDKWSKTAWVDFTDGKGEKRYAFLFRSKIRDDASDSRISEEAGEDGVTGVSLAANSEGQRIILGVAERFGGRYLANDCSGDAPVRVLKKNMTPAERFREHANIWKSAAEKLKKAAEEFRAATESLDPEVLSMAESAGVFRLNGKTLANMLDGAEASLDAAVKRNAEKTEKPA